MKKKRIKIYITLGNTCKLESRYFDVETSVQEELTEEQQLIELLDAFCYGLKNFQRGTYIR